MPDRAKVGPLRVAIVGGGAVTERIHLPALAASAKVEVTAIVDPDQKRLDLLSKFRPGIHMAASTADLEHHAEMAIVAVPHHLHRDIATDLLERGLHVFVEKPLAVSMEDADALVEASRRTGRQICVGLIRRQYPSFRFVQRVVDADWLGPIRSFDFREGGVYGWPVASASLFLVAQGGGVLFDTGAHTLDMLLSWLGPFESVKYRDDARGGVDANCILDLTLRSGATGVIELSRTRGLRNTCIITGDKGELEVGVAPNSPVALRLNGLQVQGVPADAVTGEVGIHAADLRQLESFADSIQSATESLVSARHALESVRLFDACKEARKPLELPWERFQGDVDWSRFNGRRVLILGGTGFLGGRTVEALAQNSSAAIRVLVRDLSKLARVARYPVEIVRGDIGDLVALGRAVQECDYVINCTYGKGLRKEQIRVNVDAVRALVEMARRSGVRQLVHTSTVSVYGVVKSGVLDESIQSRAPRAEIYGYTKWKGEQMAIEKGRRLGLPVVVIQPTTIYGPGAPSWTLNPLGLLKSGRVVLVDGGVGVSNAVFVDDVVTALLRAALEERAAGERLLVSGLGVVSWREFFGAYDEMLGGHHTVSMDAEAIRKALREQKRQSGNVARLRSVLREEYQGRARLIDLPAIAAVRNVVRGLVPRNYIERMKHRVITSETAIPRAALRTDATHLPSSDQEAFFRAAAIVDYSRAADIIGYVPRYSLQSGMSVVSQWAAWANVL